MVNGYTSFVPLQTIQMGIVMYAPAVALEAVVGLPLWISIAATAAVAILYTTLVYMYCDAHHVKACKHSVEL